jgi:hypothetical protein
MAVTCGADNGDGTGVDGIVSVTTCESAVLVALYACTLNETFVPAVSPVNWYEVVVALTLIVVVWVPIVSEMRYPCGLPDTAFHVNCAVVEFTAVAVRLGVPTLGEGGGGDGIVSDTTCESAVLVALYACTLNETFVPAVSPVNWYEVVVALTLIVVVWVPIVSEMRYPCGLPDTAFHGNCADG